MHTTHLLNDKEPHNFEFWYPLNGQSEPQSSSTCMGPAWAMGAPS